MVLNGVCVTFVTDVITTSRVVLNSTILGVDS